MTTVFGQGDNPNTFAWSDGAIWNQSYNSLVTISDVGRIVDIVCYFGGDTAGCTGGPVLYQGSNGNVLQYLGFSVSKGSRSSGGGFTITNSTFDISFNSGITYRVGAFRNSADSWVTPFNTGVGAYSFVLTTSGTAPAGAAGGSDWSATLGTGSNGGFEGYGHYFPITLWVKRSGTWSKVAWQLRSGGGWPTPVPKVYVKRSGVWTQVGIVAKEQELDWKKEFPCVIQWDENDWEYGLLRWQYDNKKIFGASNPALAGA